MAEDYSEKLVAALSEVKNSLDQMSSGTKKSDWMKSGQLELASIISGDLNLQKLAQDIITYLTTYISAVVGKIYLVNDTLELLASFGKDNETAEGTQIKLATGLLQKGPIVFFNESQQFSIFVPLAIDTEVIGVLEFVTSQVIDSSKMEFLRKACSTAAKALKSCQQFTQMQRELSESKQQQEKLTLASKNKTLFMAKMSHELRTPLTSLLLLSQKLADNDEGNLTYEQIEAASMINQAGHDLLDLINDILDHSKVEAGSLKIHKAPVSIRSIVENLQRQFLPLARDKELQFLIIVNDDVPLNVTTDGKRIAQVLKNFLSNSFKFTSKGPVTLKIQRPHQGIKFTLAHLQANNCLGFSVIDTGIGISKENQERIFEDFQQADDTIDKTFGGTGLGLSISRELAKMLQGEIHLESEPGKGSSFTLYIPCVERDQAVLSPFDEIEKAFCHIEQQQARPIKKVLVVEESIDQQRVLMKLLNKKSIEAVFVGTYRNGLYHIASEIFDCILLDGQLSDMTAVDFLKILSEKSILQLPPVIVSRAKQRLQECASSYTITELGSLLLLYHKNKPTGALQRISAAPPMENAKVLIVDDDMRSVLAISSTLKKAGMKVVLANTVQAALDRLENEPDIKIVIMNGFEAIYQVRQERRYANLPIIALSSKPIAEDKIRATEVGANDVLSKPVDISLLLNSIKIWLSNPTTASRMGQSRCEVGILQ